MAKFAIVGKARKPHAKKDVTRGPNADLSGAPPEIEAYAASLRKMTNSEVSSQAELAVSKLTPGAEMDESVWWRIRVLFDELRWRLSGLE